QPAHSKQTASLSRIRNNQSTYFCRVQSSRAQIGAGDDFDFALLELIELCYSLFILNKLIDSRTRDSVSVEKVVDKVGGIIAIAEDHHLLAICRISLDQFQQFHLPLFGLHTNKHLLHVWHHLMK